MPDELHPGTMITVNAAQDQSAACPREKNIKSPARGAGFHERDAIYVAHCGPKRSGLSCRALLYLIVFFSLVKKKFQQRHPYRYAVGRLFEVDSLRSLSTSGKAHPREAADA